MWLRNLFNFNECVGWNWNFRHKCKSEIEKWKTWKDENVNGFVSSRVYWGENYWQVDLTNRDKNLYEFFRNTAKNLCIVSRYQARLVFAKKKTLKS